MDSSITAEASPPAETLTEHPVAPQTPPVVAQNPAGVSNSSSEIISQRYPQRSHRPQDRYEPTLTFGVNLLLTVACRYLYFPFLKGKEV